MLEMRFGVDCKWMWALEKPTLMELFGVVAWSTIWTSIQRGLREYWSIMTFLRTIIINMMIKLEDNLEVSARFCQRKREPFSNGLQQSGQITRLRLWSCFDRIHKIVGYIILHDTTTTYNLLIPMRPKKSISYLTYTIYESRWKLLWSFVLILLLLLLLLLLSHTTLYTKASVSV